MDFEGLQPADYDNVRSLNFAFLKLLQDKNQGRRYVRELPNGLARRLQQLIHTEIGWLSSTPFLLFSFRERDDEFWRNLLCDNRDRELFGAPPKASDEASRLASAGLAFIWQLADRNPFAARLVCEATTHWCEQITERTIFDLLAIGAHRPELLVLRAQHDAELWKKLLDNGLNHEAEIRSSAYISALQYMLTRQPAASIWSAAACASRSPTLKVADETQT